MRTLLLLTWLWTTGCQRSDTAEVAEKRVREEDARVARFEARRQGRDSTASASDPLARWLLPDDLREISGLALLKDGRLIAHGDEHSRVYVLDPRRGTHLKQFTIGRTGDFEGVTVMGDTIVLATSDGRLFFFGEGTDGETVPHRLEDTRLGKECEFEGVVWDEVINSIVLVCKNVQTKKLRDHLVLYRWSLDSLSSPRVTTLALPLGNDEGPLPWASLHPSDITIDPASGHYVIVAAPEKVLLVLTREGSVIRTEQLPDGHPQTEGIAITTDSVLVLSDEARSGPAALTLYRWRSAGSP
ncbi:MAG: SdiA-regulated domain-containing protein [Gemmatimonadota bacterium]